MQMCGDRRPGNALAIYHEAAMASGGHNAGCNARDDGLPGAW